MAIDYDEFRRTTWEGRLAIFSALPPTEKAELVRSQVSGWLERHAAELTPQQVELLEEAARMTVPEMYVSRKPDDLLARIKDFEKRAASLLTPEQFIDALTMQWGSTCEIHRRP